MCRGHHLVPCHWWALSGSAAEGPHWRLTDKKCAEQAYLRDIASWVPGHHNKAGDTFLLFVSQVLWKLCLHYTVVYWVQWASLVTQLVKNLPAVWETWVRSMGWEDPLGKGKATHSSILALQSMGSQRVGHNWMTFTSLHFISWEAKTPYTSWPKQTKV